MTDKRKDEIVAPREPTREMLLRGFDALDCTSDTFENRLNNIGKIYKAMTEDCDEADLSPPAHDVAEADEAMNRIVRNCPSYGAFECSYQSETDFKTVRAFIRAAQQPAQGDKE